MSEQESIKVWAITERQESVVTWARANRQQHHHQNHQLSSSPSLSFNHHQQPSSTTSPSSSSSTSSFQEIKNTDRFVHIEYEVGILDEVHLIFIQISKGIWMRRRRRIRRIRRMRRMKRMRRITQKRSGRQFDFQACSTLDNNVIFNFFLSLLFLFSPTFRCHHRYQPLHCSSHVAQRHRRGCQRAT